MRSAAAASCISTPQESAFSLLLDPSELSASSSTDELKISSLDTVAKPAPTFGHANANFSVFIECIRFYFPKK